MKIGDYEIQVPFVTTSAEAIPTIHELADCKPGQKVVDLGSGNGRVIIEFAKAGAIATGLETKEDLVKQSQAKIAMLGLSDKATVYHHDFWQTDLSPFDIVYLYGMRSILGRLEKKLEAELRPGTKVISNIFTFPHWKVKKTKKSVHLYIV